MLSGAPFGNRYVRKSEQSAAYYEIEVEEPIVRLVYDRYTNGGLSIGASLVFSTTVRPSGLKFLILT